MTGLLRLPNAELKASEKRTRRVDRRATPVRRDPVAPCRLGVPSRAAVGVISR
jgi:hypothetical protein